MPLFDDYDDYDDYGPSPEPADLDDDLEPQRDFCPLCGGPRRGGDGTYCFACLSDLEELRWSAP